MKEKNCLFISVDEKRIPVCGAQHIINELAIDNAYNVTLFNDVNAVFLKNA